MSERTAGLVLAAGEGRRFGGPTALVLYEGERLVDRCVRLLTEGGCALVVVVLGAWVGDVPGALVAVNGDWASGMGGSLAVGLSELAALDVDRVVVTLVDLIGLSAAAVTRVVESDARLVVATYDGRRRHPFAFGREHWGPVASSGSSDSGARDYLDAHAQEVTLIEVGDVASEVDLDEPLP